MYFISIREGPSIERSIHQNDDSHIYLWVEKACITMIRYIKQYILVKYQGIYKVLLL